MARKTRPARAGPGKKRGRVCHDCRTAHQGGNVKIFNRYLGVTVISATATVLVVLLALFTFFSFIDELEKVGTGSYGIVQAALFVSLSMPGLAYELFPMAALIGSLLGLGTLMRNSEITVIRCAGVPKMHLMLAVMKAGLIFVFIAVCIGEFIAPPAERFAREYRSIAISDRIALKTQNGLWARDGNSYINIREILPGDRLEDIYIYEFDADNRLRISTHADHARYDDAQWVLEDISQTIFEDGEIEQRQVGNATWDSLLKPDLITMIAIKPDSLSIWDLIKYIVFLSNNGQNSLRYEHALWVKVTYPFATAVMVFLAIPMVLGAVRSTTVGQSILIGGLIGLGFHLLNQAAGHLGIVFDLPPVVSAAGPMLIMLMLGLGLLTRTV
jgi:lipopolysaccharide export system permease protein